MKRILFVTMMAGFCFTISCASKKTTLDTQEVTVEKPNLFPRPTTKDQDMTKDDKTQKFSCLVAGEQRVVILNELNTNDKKCNVEYTKKGETTEVAWAQATPDICTKTFNNIRQNIENAGFKCGLSFENIKKESKAIGTADVNKTKKGETNN